MRRPVTRSRSKALEESRCNLCCREIVALKPLTECNANGKKPKSRLRNVSCTSLIPRDVFDAGIMKKWNALPDDSESDGESRRPPPPKKKQKVSSGDSGESPRLPLPKKKQKVSSGESPRQPPKKKQKVSSGESPRPPPKKKQKVGSGGNAETETESRPPPKKKQKVSSGDNGETETESHRQPPKKKLKVSSGDGGSNSKSGGKRNDKKQCCCGSSSSSSGGGGGKEGGSAAPAVCVDLPDEIWLKIFRFVLAGGQYPTMHRLQLVCRRWHGLSRHSSLWRAVDLSCAGTRWIPYRDSSLEWLSKHRLHALTKVNLHGWHCLTSQGLEHLAKHCVKLRAIELAFCSNISRDAIFCLTEHCKDLSRVSLANTSSDVVCVYPMVHLAESTGLKLTALDLSGNLLRGFNTVMNSLCENCPNLEDLDVGRCRGDLIHMDVESWQHSLPRLRLFSLSYSIFQTVQVPPPSRPSPGWPNLQVLLLAMSSSGGTKVPPPIDDALIRRFLSNSCSLRHLDVRGCQEVSASNLLSLTLPSIRTLELGMVCDAQEGGLEKLLHKYGSQLQEVNLSWTTYPQPVIRAAVQALVRASRTPPRLRLLFLARTHVLPDDVVEIVQRLSPCLARLELKDCTHLPPDWCKLFNSELRMQKLHRLVRTYVKEKKKEEEEEKKEEEEGEGEEEEEEENEDEDDGD